MSLPSSAYDWNNTPLWGTNPPGLDFQTSSQSSNVLDHIQYGTWSNRHLAPYSQNWNNGYDAIASDGRYVKAKNGKMESINVNTANTIWDKLIQHSNGNFCNKLYHVPLFIDSVSFSLGISGSTGQGRKTRDFYPHNITIPSFQITGQCYSTAHYGSLIEYIHMAQHQALSNVKFDGALTSDMVQFYLKATPYQNGADRKGTSNVVFTKPNKTQYVHPTQKIVGNHEQIICKGYISSIQRTHRAGDHRPTWSCQFIVAEMISSGIYTEKSKQVKETGTWLDLLTGTKSQNWLTSFNEKNNVKTLKSVDKDVGNVMNELESAVTS